MMRSQLAHFLYTRKQHYIGVTFAMYYYYYLDCFILCTHIIIGYNTPNRCTYLPILLVIRRNRPSVREAAQRRYILQCLSSWHRHVVIIICQYSHKNTEFTTTLSCTIISQEFTIDCVVETFSDGARLNNRVLKYFDST